MNYTATLNPSFAISRYFPIKFKSLPKLLWFFILASTAFLLILYVYQVNNATSVRYSVKDYERKIAEISAQNKKLEMATLGINPLESALSSADELDFERAEKIHYIRVINNQVVVR